MKDVLEIKFMSGDLNRELTVRQYLKVLLVTLWDEGESFSAKRPFGNSGWQYDLYAALIKVGAIEGSLDDEGCVRDFDKQYAHSFVAGLIRQM